MNARTRANRTSNYHSLRACVHVCVFGNAPSFTNLRPQCRIYMYANSASPHQRVKQARSLYAIANLIQRRFVTFRSRIHEIASRDARRADFPHCHSKKVPREIEQSGGSNLHFSSTFILYDERMRCPVPRVISAGTRPTSGYNRNLLGQEKN